MSEALHNTGLLGRPEEYFRPDHTHLWARRWGLARQGQYERFIAAAVAFGTTPNGIFSVKLHHYQFVWLLERLREIPGVAPESGESDLLASAIPGPRYVFLTRREKSRQAVSYFLAAQSQEWFQLGAAPGAPSSGVAARRGGNGGETIPGDELADLQTIRWLEQALIEQEGAWRAFLTGSEVESFEVAYEDFSGGYEGTVLAVLDFMDVVPPPGFRVQDPELKRQSNARTEELVDRYLTVRSSIEQMPAGATWSKEERRYVSPSLAGSAEP